MCTDELLQCLEGINKKNWTQQCCFKLKTSVQIAIYECCCHLVCHYLLPSPPPPPTPPPHGEVTVVLGVTAGSRVSSGRTWEERRTDVWACVKWKRNLMRCWRKCCHPFPQQQLFLKSQPICKKDNYVAASLLERFTRVYRNLHSLLERYWGVY